MKYATIRQRQKQRKRLAKSIRDFRGIRHTLTKEAYQDGIMSLLQVASNYPKLKQV